MRKKLLSALLVCTSLLLVIGCKKENKEENTPTDQTVNTSLDPIPAVTEQESVMESEAPKQEPIDTPKEEVKDTSKKQNTTKKKETKKITGVLPEKTADVQEEEIAIKEEIVEDNKVYIAVTTKAEYPGGMQAFNKQFISRFRAPDLDPEVKRLQVIVQFTIEKDGSISDLVVARDPGYGAGKEAARVILSMPRWKPAIHEDKIVRSQFTMPITIQVQ